MTEVPARVNPPCTAENTARFTANTLGGPEKEPADILGGALPIDAACFSMVLFRPPRVYPKIPPGTRVRGACVEGGLGRRGVM